MPNCKDLKSKTKESVPGPGFYEKNVNDTSILSDHKRSNSESGGMSTTLNPASNKNN